MADEYKPSSDEFMRDVKHHWMRVLMDNGSHRHLVFHGKSGMSAVGKIEIVTFPGSLVITGDMGTWVFSRVDDMFQFFRNDERVINPYYWSEKIQNGVSGGRRNSGCQEYCPLVFKQNVIEDLDNYDFEDYDTTKAEVLEALDADIEWNESYRCVIDQLNDLEVGRWSLSEPWEIQSEKWCYHYIWCCRFIVWAIMQYDAFKGLTEVKGNE